MKDKLTKEQSAHLISLGVPKEKATGNYSEIEIFDYPVFTLTDILEILPKEIDYYNRPCELSIWFNRTYQKWYVGYLDFSIFLEETRFMKEELIDSLYSLCVFCLENKLLKFEKL